MSERKARYGRVFYGLEDQEILDHEIDEVLERHFDHLPVEQMPETVRVLVWRHCPIDVEGQAEAMLESLLERLDEDHADPGGYSTTKPTPGMRAAARAMVRQVALEYDAWSCEPTGEHETVRVREWGEGRRA